MNKNKIIIRGRGQGAEGMRVVGKEWQEKVGEGGICGGTFHDLVMVLLVFTKVHNWYNTKPNLVLLNVRQTQFSLVKCSANYID